MNKTKLRSKNGITLIALVITIVVILILAGVSIATLTGDNGLLSKAQSAKIETEKSAIEEQRSLAKVEASLNENVTTYTKTLDGKEVTVTIPEGFARTKIEGESNIEEGMVIIDEDGNEFVWVSCTKEEYADATNQKGSWAQGGYSDKTWNDETVEGTISYDDRLASVEKYGGFYVARYEAGIPDNATEIYANTDGATYTNASQKNEKTILSKYIPVSKKGVQAWNYISQTNAKIVAQKMVSNSSVQSYLIDSYAWDIICKKIKSIGNNITDSTKWGNYYNNKTTNYEGLNTLYAVHQYNNGWIPSATYSKGKVTGAPKGTGTSRLELSTGASEDFKVYNIYDMAGNMWEWTTETSTNGYAVRRGGSFNDNGSYYPVVCRYGNNGVGGTNVHFGFRSVLYLK